VSAVTVADSADIVVIVVAGSLGSSQCHPEQVAVG